MASVIYNEYKRAVAAGEIDWDADTIKARLVMANTTCGSQNDGIVTISNFTTLDVADATGYADVSLASKAVNKDDGNDRAELDAADVVFSGLSGNASRNYVGVLIYKYVSGTDASDKVIAYVQFASAISSAATQVTIPWDAEGILHFT